MWQAKKMREVGTPDVQDEGNINDISQHSTLNRKLFFSVEAFPVDWLRDIKQRDRTEVSSHCISVCTYIYMIKKTKSTKL